MTVITGKLKIGVIGLGAMGLGMATCLAKAGFEVTGFDINQEASKRLQDEGGRVAGTPRESSADADLLAIVVATSDQASSVLFNENTGALATLPQDIVILLCIAAAPEYVVDLESRLKAADRSDVRLLGCPISGGEVRAWEGTLSLLCAGKDIDAKYVAKFWTVSARNGILFLVVSVLRRASRWFIKFWLESIFSPASR
ncbi:Fc.00g011140.m01.CDS01 [Cosmosporella sp. VM-42]